MDLVLLDDRAANQVSDWVQSDPLGRRTFGENYRPPHALGVDGISAARFGYVVINGGGEAFGFLEVSLTADVARLGFYLKPSGRSHEVAREAIDLLAADLRGRAEALTAAVSPEDRSTMALFGAAGFRGDQVDADGQVQLHRPI